MAALCLNFSSSGQDIKISIKGIVINEKKMPIGGATISVQGKEVKTKTNSDGAFSLIPVDIGSAIIISSVGYQTKIISNVLNSNIGIVQLQQDENQLKEIEIVSNGYLSLPKERSPGSFVKIDNDLINRSVSTNVLDRLDGVTSGLIFNKNTYAGDLSNRSGIAIRGRSTIYANPNPLIVIDNFPYNGNLASINPNDIESITVLKDAAAASIWGAFSGNGVIVITSKKGKAGQKIKIELNNTISIGEKPDLNYAPRLSSGNYIDIEQFLFNKGYYNSAITRANHPVLSPVIDIFVNKRNNKISSADSARSIDQYKHQDTRSDMSGYLYRRPVNQQYAINISGGSLNNIFYLSIGHNKDLSAIQRNDYGRVTIDGSNTYTFFDRRLSWTNVFNFTKSSTKDNGLNAANLPYPYLKLKNQDGSANSVPFQYRQGYVDTVGAGNLLDWNYRPLDELASNDNAIKLTEYRYNTRLAFIFFKGFEASIQYQYNEGLSTGRNLHPAGSYYTRDYINKFTQFNKITGQYSRPVPTGGISDQRNQNFISQNLRGQLNFEKRWKENNQITVLGGYEVRAIDAIINNNRSYGYDDLGINGLIDYTTFFKYFHSSATSRIAQNNSRLGTTNRYISYFANLSYAYKERYILSASGRKDKSNIFGVKTNQKGVPLWSLGASWEINKEPFYNLEWLPYLRLRITNGYNGNIDNSLSSLITAVVNTGNYYNTSYSELINPPNPELRWEKVNTTNFGLDFSFNKILSGSVEYYIKNGSDLIGTSNIDPTVGVNLFKGNSANMQGRGLDMSLNSRNIKGKLGWTTTVLFSHSTDKVTKYLLKSASIGDAISSDLNPVEGHPLYSLYSFKWAGIDAQGDPQVYFNGKISKDYSEIIYSGDLSNLDYSGPVNPTLFGSLRNDFSWKNLNLSVNITYKFGYYFRRPSINSSDVFTGQFYHSNNEYLNRWQKAGDEAQTNIPALKYPADAIRDQTYKYSSILIEKGDHIRLKDISLSYALNKSHLSKLPFERLTLYGYVNNIGMLWKANRRDLDPDYVPTGSLVYPNPRTYSLGIKAEF